LVKSHCISGEVILLENGHQEICFVDSGCDTPSLLLQQNFKKIFVKFCFPVLQTSSTLSGSLITDTELIILDTNLSCTQTGTMGNQLWTHCERN